MGSIQNFDIKQLSHKFGIGTFVETGTYQGSGTEYAYNAGFKQIHTIEIDPDYYFAAQYRFKDCGNIFLHLGSSHFIISSMVNSLFLKEENVLFWLDAHFPLADKGEVSYRHTTDPEVRMPIISELQAIVRNRGNGYSDVIIIDDLRCFVDDARIPAASFDDHMKSLGARGEGCTRDSVVGVSLEEILRVTEGKFLPQLVFEDEGYILLLPCG